MDRENLEKLSKSELIALLLGKKKTKPTRANRPTQTLRRKQKVVADRPGMVLNPETNRWIKIGGPTYLKRQKVKPWTIRNPETNRWIKIGGPSYKKVFPMQHALNEINKLHQKINKYKRTISSIDEKGHFDFDDDIFQTENTSIGKFKIISIRNRENKKFKSATNEFKVKILKKLDDVKEIYHIFHELVKTVKKRRKLSNNDMLRIVIQNEELPKAISTKFKKVKDFELGDLDDVIRILEYRGISIEKCNIIVQSVKIPVGKGRLLLTKDTISRKNCIITVKNDDSICLARSIVTALANLHPENWSTTQLKNGFNASRKLQKDEALKLHEEANVEIND